MSARGLVLLLLLCTVGWWYSPVSPRPQRAPASADRQPVACSLPPRVASGAPPLQTPVPPTVGAFVLDAARLDPLAGFSAEARVLSRKNYRHGREAELSPVDLALGWGQMQDDAVLSRLSISQGGRFYSYRWQGQPPLPPGELVRSSANMHMIPASDEVAEALHDLEPGDEIRIEGWLVEARAPDGWRWRSSITRDDSGAGACELVYVCAIGRL